MDIFQVLVQQPFSENGFLGDTNLILLYMDNVLYLTLQNDGTMLCICWYIITSTYSFIDYVINQSRGKTFPSQFTKWAKQKCFII